MLAPLSGRLFQKSTFETAIHAILDDVIALVGAEYGNIQLSLGGELVIVAQRGLQAPFLNTFRRVKQDDDCACGRALRLGEPVIIADVEKDPDFVAFIEDANLAGFRAVQSTPLFTTDRKLLGVVSTHFARVHTPTPIEMETLKEYGILAADHLHKLLGHVSLATKAKQMNDELYNSILGDRTAPETTYGFLATHLPS